MSNELVRDARPADSKSVLVFSAMEFHVKYMMISLIQKKDSEFEAIDIGVSEFSKYFGLKWGGEQTKALKAAIENLTKNRYIINDNIIKWLADESSFADGKIHLKLDNSLKPYLLQTETNFTLYNYESVKNFTSKYSYHVYEFLKSAEGMGFYKISLDDAITIFGDGCCKTKSEFLKRVLNPALRDINKHSDLHIRKRFHKPFGKPEQIWFSIQSKPNKDQTPPINDGVREQQQKKSKE